MNTSKTKIMSNTVNREVICIDNNEIEYIEDYTYLGQTMSFHDKMTKEIDKRVANAWKRFWSLKEIMKSKTTKMSIKRKVFNTCILPVMTYGCETWALTKAHMHKLQVCQRSMERSMLGLRMIHHIEIKEIRKITEVDDVTTKIKTQKWRWTGHMIRGNQEKWTQMVTVWYPRDQKRKKGRPYQRWDDDIKKVAGPLWMRTARDREAWKRLEEAYVQGTD
ncbi:hypothetical protein JYU34_013337 [Plutella xylostella]|uniref:Endonuclease-reverse transcriptase n=1 Tax=Plutella xylostella TaxID=51655 RepID=A0ABQ7Q9M0_PLUXY|nr:hypothetical protein JYU34_019319 [Plutella xylostella]KAG7301919.1 hypothetical protein JYU34_013337 [Plutella xylostella]